MLNFLISYVIAVSMVTFVMIIADTISLRKEFAITLFMAIIVVTFLSALKINITWFEKWITYGKDRVLIVEIFVFLSILSFAWKFSQ